jgi:hypothetical protein
MTKTNQRRALSNYHVGQRVMLKATDAHPKREAIVEDIDHIDVGLFVATGDRKDAIIAGRDVNDDDTYNNDLAMISPDDVAYIIVQREEVPR